ncbi:hypothetical protein L0665_09255 [Methanogenium marinum]|uniref:Antitoxin SocA-like Panacea domain-containing protein n=1 Tax=Methanogenium marinum TaxID=348610 RepID=A0A9Q4KQQ8_9EURY|nr:hypothetical protein [Methanogenium marinum]MDE4908793.1 hypothetical protein [Methanogenium marinum]
MADSDLSFEQEEAIRNKFIAILLSGADRPIKNKINFQKELFLFSKSFPKFFEFFEFIPHYYGPYSSSAADSIDNHDDYFVSDTKGIYLTAEGKNLAEESIQEFTQENREKIIISLNIVRSLYDSLTSDELMFLVYKTYGYTEKSDKIDSLLKNKEYLAGRLLKKGVITEKRYRELIED